MAYELSLQRFTYIAGADFTNHQYKFITVDSNGNAQLCAAGKSAAGVTQDNPVQGASGEAAFAGISKVVSGGTIKWGAPVQASTNGVAIAATTGNIVLGQSFSGAAANDIFPVLLNLANWAKLS